MRHTQTIEIDRPVREVFEYLTDPTLLPEWDTDIRRGHALSEGHVGVGTRIEIERTLPPSRRYGVLRGRITEYRPTDAFAVTIDEGPMPFDLRYEFDEREDTTRLRVLIESHPRGIRRLIEVAFAPLIHRSVASHYRALKRVLEAPARAE